MLPFRLLTQDDNELVQDALRVVALAMEAGHWDIVQWMLQHHESEAVAAYFLPAIAQQGSTADMARMLGLIDEMNISPHQQGYVNEQVCSLVFGIVGMQVALSGPAPVVAPVGDRLGHA